MDKKAKKTLSRVGNIALTVFLVFAIIVTVYSTIITASSDGVPSVGDKVFLSIQSDSMEGDRGFSEGSLIVATKLSAEEKKNLQVDDVITFWKDLDGDGVEELNTHRIIECLGDLDGEITYQTKGDHNVGEDTYVVKVSSIVAQWHGKEFKGVGSFLTFMTSKIGFLLIIVLPLAVFFIFEIINLIKVINQMRGKKSITAQDEEEIKRKAIEDYLKSQALKDTATPTTDNKEEENN